MLVATLARGAEPGSILWKRQFGPDYYEVGAGVDVVAGGNIVVAGYQEDWTDSIYYGFVALFDRDGLRCGKGGWRRASDLRASTRSPPMSPATSTPLATARSLIHVILATAIGTRCWSSSMPPATGSGCAASGGGRPRGVVADDDGVLVVGTHDFGRPNDAFLTRFDHTGRRLWTRWMRGDGYDFAHGVTRDPAGNILVVGTTEGLDGRPYHPSTTFVAKFTADGRRLWCREFDRLPSSDGQDDGALGGVASDAAGNIVIAGETTDEAGGVFAAKLDPDGRLLWTRQFGEPFHDVAFGVAVDGAGNSVLVGRAVGGPVGGPPIGDFDAFVIKLDPEGGKLWGRQVGTPTSDWAAAVAIDAADDAVLVTGLTQGDFVRPVAGAGDGFLVRISPLIALLPPQKIREVSPAPPPRRRRRRPAPPS